MKTRFRRCARLFALAAMFFVLPLGPWGCSDDDDGSTGPSSSYNPDADYSGATITAQASRSKVGPGETFDISATFLDASGNPVEGAPLAVAVGNAGAAGFFTYGTNPTPTDAGGRARIGVTVSPKCPGDGFTFFVAISPPKTGSGGQPRGEVQVLVLRVNAMKLEAGGNVPAGTQAFFKATVDATPGCTVTFKFRATGAGLNFPEWLDAPPGSVNPWTFQIPSPDTATGILTPGTLNVGVLASCAETDATTVTGQSSVTVF